MMQNRDRRNSRSSIVRNQEWDSALAQLDTLDLAKLVFGLLGLDAVHSEATLGVVDETEVLASLLDGDHVHESSGVGGISADLAVDLDKALHENCSDLATVEGILQTVVQEIRCQLRIARRHSRLQVSGNRSH